MILYNIRKNGPYEYDKWILNIGQIHNAAVDLYDNAKPIRDLKTKRRDIDILLDDELLRANRMQILKNKYFSRGT